MSKKFVAPKTDATPPAPVSALDVLDANYVPKYDIIINIDRSKLTWGDLMLLSSFEGNEEREISGHELLAMGKLFDHVIVGGVKDLPLDATPDILRALNGALKADAETKN